ncbi:cell wall-binding repeat-containing protein, partial [Myceligenerans halotolerans]
VSTAKTPSHRSYSHDFAEALVTRLSGAHRYETSAAVAAQYFGEGVPVAYVAAGGNFPDALSGAPVAGAQDAPILLTRTDSVPDAVGEVMRDLKPQRIVVLGGEGAVSDAVVSELQGMTEGTVTRLAGSNRYETSVAISQSAFPDGSDKVYLANGGNFPDALSGGPVATMHDAPVLLTRTGKLPPAVQDELKRLEPSQIVILGGTGVISAGLKAELENYVVGE